jgi:hypothetical protein
MPDRYEEVEWRSSSFCGSTTCLEVAFLADRVLLRNSTAPQAEPLDLTWDEWRDFLKGAKAAEFDLPPRVA